MQAARRFLGLARRRGAFTAVEEELADVIITAYVTAAAFDIDIDTVIAHKVDTVLARGWRENEAGEER